MASMCRHVRISHPASRAAAAHDSLCDWDINPILTCRGWEPILCLQISALLMSAVCRWTSPRGSGRRSTACWPRCVTHYANIFPIDKQIFSPGPRCATFRSGCRPTATRTMISPPTSGSIRYLLEFHTAANFMAGFGK